MVLYMKKTERHHVEQDADRSFNNIPPAKHTCGVTNKILEQDRIHYGVGVWGGVGGLAADPSFFMASAVLQIYLLPPCSMNSILIIACSSDCSCSG